MVTARLLSPLTSTKGRRGFLRGQLLRDSGNDDFLVQPLGTSGSHLLASLAEANCLAVVDEDVTDVSVGEEIAGVFPRPAWVSPWRSPSSAAVGTPGGRCASVR